MSDHLICACRIMQNNMAPRHFAGDWIVFDADEPPHVGGDVVAELTDGTVIVWRLDAMTDDELVVTSYTPHVTQTIARSSVRRLYWAMYSKKDRDMQRLRA